MSRLNFLLSLPLLLTMPSHALLARHNEQGLSLTHCYKRSGPEEEISNLNGNLVITDKLVAKPGAPLGVNVVRTWNSHWRDPLFTFQYDMNYNAIDNADSTKHHPTYGDHVVDDEDAEIGGFAHIRLQRFGTPAEVPSMWGFAQSVSLSMVEAAANEAITKAINTQYGQEMAAIEQLFAKGDPDSKAKATLALQTLDIMIAKETKTAQLALSGSIYMLNGGVDDMELLVQCAQSATGERNSASGNCGDAMFRATNGLAGGAIDAAATNAMNNALGTTISTPIPVVSLAQMGYGVANGSMSSDDMAWQVGTIVGQQIAAAIAGGAAAGGVAGVAVAAAIEMTRLYIQLQAEWSKTFDVGEVGLDPWKPGVNGYVGLLGVNHDPELQRAQARFQRKWTHWDTSYARGTNGGTQAPIITPVAMSVSRHPMPDLQLVGADGGASRFILSDDSARTVNGRRWVAYVNLSNADRRQVYYCLPKGVLDVDDVGQEPLQAVRDGIGDSSGSWVLTYVVSDPVGTPELLLDDTGSVVGRYAYGPFGELEDYQGSRTVDFLYGGREWDGDLEAGVFGYRLYDPEMGQFLSTDPMDQYWNTYSYVGGSPLDNSDEWGLYGEGEADPYQSPNNWTTTSSTSGSTTTVTAHYNGGTCVDATGSMATGSGYNMSIAMPNYGLIGQSTNKALLSPSANSARNGLQIGMGLSDISLLFFGFASTDLGGFGTRSASDSRSLLRKAVRNLRRSNPKMRMRGMAQQTLAKSLEVDAANAMRASNVANGFGALTTIGFSMNEYKNYLQSGGDHPMRYKVYLSAKAGLGTFGAVVGSAFFMETGPGAIAVGALGYYAGDRLSQLIYIGMYGNE